MPEARVNRAARFERSFTQFPVSQIGGGRVVRAFNMGGQRVPVGAVMSADAIANMSANNRRVLLDRFIAVWPKPADAALLAAAPTDGADRTERHVVALGFGRYNVIDGTVLNDKAVGRSDAYALAGKSEPKK